MHDFYNPRLLERDRTEKNKNVYDILQRSDQVWLEPVQVQVQGHATIHTIISRLKKGVRRAKSNIKTTREHQSSPGPPSSLAWFGIEPRIPFNGLHPSSDLGYCNTVGIEPTSCALAPREERHIFIFITDYYAFIFIVILTFNFENGICLVFYE